MLPVTHGVQETTRQIALYTVLMVALTLVFFAVAQMGLVFLAGALVLGGLFLLQAFAMARDGTDARAVRLYKYSITYLTGALRADRPRRRRLPAAAVMRRRSGLARCCWWRCS